VCDFQGLRGWFNWFGSPGLVYSFWMARVHRDQAALAGFGWCGHWSIDLLIFSRDGVLPPWRHASGRIWVLVWLVISAKVVTWRCMQQLLRVQRSLVGYLVSKKSSIKWWSCCLSGQINHGSWRWMEPLI